MQPSGRNIIVIGTSAGGHQALDQLIGQLPGDIPASLFIVQHMPPEATGFGLVNLLAKHTRFQIKLASDRGVFRPGGVYIAPPDFHLLLKPKRLLVTKGARENSYRPAIDPMFRSAAVTHGPRVIGVILTGMLNDGAAGLVAVKRCGGVAVVQDPADSTYPAMPSAALEAVRVDHCVRLDQMGTLLDKLARARPGKRVPIPAEIRIEAEIAERVVSDVAQVNGLGHQVPYNCPNCGGVLWMVEKKRGHRYRCHVGHSFTGSSLHTIQSEKIEETLWIALRMLEERKNLLNEMARSAGGARNRVAYLKRASETGTHVERVRAMLLAREPKLVNE